MHSLGIAAEVKGERRHAQYYLAEGACREAGQDGELGQPGCPAIGLHPQAVHLAVMGGEQPVDTVVVLKR